MIAEDVMKKELKGPYTGYMPVKVYEHKTVPFAWEGCRELLKVPHKITYFFKRKLIVEVRKSFHEKDPRDNYYLLQLTDGTYLEVEY